MPNHIQNRLRIIGTPERVAEIISRIKGDESEQIDFEKIFPSPEVIKQVGEISHNIVTAVKAKYQADVSSNPLLAALELSSREKIEIRDEDNDVFKLACRAYEQTGFVYWYDWNIHFWGTKWNAYGQNDRRNTSDTIYFQTAWSAPRPIIKRLGEMFPDVEFYLAYADEDTGSNAGLILYKDGVFTENRFKNQSKEAYDLYFELNPDDINKYRLVGDTYEYIEN